MENNNFAPTLKVFLIARGQFVSFLCCKDFLLQVILDMKSFLAFETFQNVAILCTFDDYE